MFNPELDRGLALAEGNVQALVGQRDLQTLALPRVIGKECSEHSFEFIVAAGRRVQQRWRAPTRLAGTSALSNVPCPRTDSHWTSPTNKLLTLQWAK